MRQLRIDVIGAGHIGETHSIMLSQIASCRPDQLVLAAVADRDRARRERLQSYYGYRRTFDSSEDLIQSGEVDAVFVCTPTRFHADAIRLAALHGLRRGQTSAAVAREGGVETREKARRVLQWHLAHQPRQALLDGARLLWCDRPAVRHGRHVHRTAPQTPKIYRRLKYPAHFASYACRTLAAIFAAAG